MTTVLRRIKDSKDEILVSANDRSSDSQDVYRMNVNTGRKSLLTLDHPGSVLRWVLTADLQPLAALSHDRKGKRWWTSVRAADGKAWVKVAEWNEQLRDVIAPLGFDPADASLLYVCSNVGRDTLGVFKFDARTGKLGELVAGTQQYDLGSFSIQVSDAPGSFRPHRPIRARISGSTRTSAAWKTPVCARAPGSIPSRWRPCCRWPGRRAMACPSAAT